LALPCSRSGREPRAYKCSLSARGVQFWGLGFGVWGLGFGVWGLGFRRPSGSGVQDANDSDEKPTLVFRSLFFCHSCWAVGDLVLFYGGLACAVSACRFRSVLASALESGCSAMALN
jgi:hypothetical protein